MTSSSFYKVQTVRKTLESLTRDETHDLMGTIGRLLHRQDVVLRGSTDD